MGDEFLEVFCCFPCNPNVQWAIDCTVVSPFLYAWLLHVTLVAFPVRTERCGLVGRGTDTNMSQTEALEGLIHILALAGEHA